MRDPASGAESSANLAHVQQIALSDWSVDCLISCWKMLHAGNSVDHLLLHIAYFAVTAKWIASMSPTLLPTLPQLCAKGQFQPFIK
jgi:hypothetical protein